MEIKYKWYIILDHIYTHTYILKNILLYFLISFVTMETNYNTHVAVLAFPFSSHPAILLAMVRRLATSAPATLFSFFSTAQSNKSIFSVSTPNNIKPYNVWDGVPDGYVLSGRHHEDIDLFMNSAPTSFEKEINVAVADTGRKVSVVITDAFLWFGAHIADKLGVPWVASWVSASVSLASHIHTDLIRETFGGKKDESHVTFIPGMSKIRTTDLPSGVLTGDLESVFHHMLHQMGQILPLKAAAVLINSFHQLEPETTDHLKSKVKNVLTIGPFNLSTPQQPEPDTHGCISWLDKQKPRSVVYIGFGSVATPPPKELVALGEALEASGVPFLWSLSRKDSLKSLLPKNGNGLVVPWAPQKKVLNHKAIGVFVTHGGWNSVLESLAGGVPVICRPFFGDHGVNSRMVEAVWEMGVTVGVFTKEEMVRCLDLILREEKGEKMREKLRALKLAAETAVGPEGSTTKNFSTLVSLISGSN